MISVVNGKNVCVFAYGPTGTGKTFTMMGDGSMQYRGLAPRILEKIFQEIEINNIPGINYKLEMELYEIYNDKLRSLLETKNGAPIEINSIK